MTKPNLNDKCCSRCNGELINRVLSWFTEETLCGHCHNLEVKFKMEYDREEERAWRLQDCGYLPDEFVLFLKKHPIPYAA